MAVSSVGCEGVDGLPLFLGSSGIRRRSEVVFAGTASRMARSDFLSASTVDGLLEVALRRYAAAVLADVERAVVCTRFHTITQQLARWLLLTADRVGANELELTHEFVAGLLGVRRASISEAVSVLKRDGLIDSRRGRLRILDRERVRSASCVCSREMARS